MKNNPTHLRRAAKLRLALSLALVLSGVTLAVISGFAELAPKTTTGIASANTASSGGVAAAPASSTPPAGLGFADWEQRLLQGLPPNGDSNAAARYLLPPFPTAPTDKGDSRPKLFLGAGWKDVRLQAVPVLAATTGQTTSAAPNAQEPAAAGPGALPPHPAERYAASMAYDAARGQVVLFGSTFPSDTWTWDGSAWTQQQPATSPPARSFAAMTYDAARQKIVLFGGVDGSGFRNDTWTWDGTNWTEVFPGNPPPARTAGVMDYNAATGVAVLFGGYSGYDGGLLNDTWTWDGSNWTEQQPANSPPARVGANMSYHAASQRMVLFGGDYFDAKFRFGQPYGVFSDTWVFDGTNWAQQAPAVSPPARHYGTMAYDGVRGRTLLVGGIDAYGLTAQTWSWDGQTWAQESPASAPSARIFAASAYDEGRQRVVLFGGFGNTFLRDTWTWDGTSWSRLNLRPDSGTWSDVTSADPLLAVGHSTAYDSARGEVVLFGGVGPTLNTGTWTWNGQAWTERTPASAPPPRLFGTMTYDAARGLVVLFGGQGFLGQLADTWTWNGITWTQQQPVDSPPGRAGASMAYEPATAESILFGGDGGGTDTWSWNGTNWLKEETLLSPPARTDAAMAYAGATRGGVVLFGGLNSFDMPLEDTWTWNGITWLREAPGPKRWGHTMSYDAVRGEIVLFGGSRCDLGVALTAECVYRDPSYIPVPETWTWRDGVWTPLGRR